MAAVAAANGFPVLSSQAYLEGKTVWGTRALVTDLCEQFYTLGWVSCTGGSITIKVHDDSTPKPDQLIVMSPSGVQKERMIPEDMYVLSSGGEVLSTPFPKPYPHKSPNCSDCAPLFMKISAYPKATTVLVRNHGIFVWGDSWISAKTQAECYHYLFDTAIRLHQLGIDWRSPSHGLTKNESYQTGSKRKLDVYANAGLAIQASIPARKCIVLDIEGTTTPIAFVTEILFPYARDNVRKHLTSTFDSLETKDDIKLLRAQVLDDLEKGILGSTPIPPDDAGKEEVIESLVINVEAMIKADRKITALKQLQGHIWRTGYNNNELQGVVFDDVPEALERWHASGIKIYIYSSGSREAQRLIFGNTTHGDLRKYLCGFFDTTVGNKREAMSYFEIFQSVGVDKPSQILFITDVYQEAVAAKGAGNLKQQQFKNCRVFYQHLGGSPNIASIRHKIVYWIKPRRHEVKINIDGEFTSDKGAGCGGLFRNSNGNCFILFLGPIAASCPPAC